MHRSYAPRPPQKQDGDVRLQRLVTRLHTCGPRAMAAFLAELGAERMIRQEIEQKLERYAAALDPVVLAQLGGDRFPTIPLRLVPREDLR